DELPVGGDDAGRRRVRRPQDDRGIGWRRRRWRRPSRSVVLRDLRRVAVTPAWRRREIAVRAQDDLVDDRAILALLDAHRLRAVGGEIDVRAERAPSVIGPSPSVDRRAVPYALQHHLPGTRWADARSRRSN